MALQPITKALSLSRHDYRGGQLLYIKTLYFPPPHDDVVRVSQHNQELT